MCALPDDDLQAVNVEGEALETCSLDPRTGFFRDGQCRTGPDDRGVHVVCAEVTDEFLSYSKSRGNDLISAVPEYGFPGLEQGDRWCLCAARWEEARQQGVAPPVVTAATHHAALRTLDGQEIVRYATQ